MTPVASRHPVFQFAIFPIQLEEPSIKPCISCRPSSEYMNHQFTRVLILKHFEEQLKVVSQMNLQNHIMETSVSPGMHGQFRPFTGQFHTDPVNQYTIPITNVAGGYETPGIF